MSRRRSTFTTLSRESRLLDTMSCMTGIETQHGHPDRTTTDVLVVGAGPVGMTTAILLASYGVRVTIVEKNSTTANDPKAISLDDESLRVFQRAGIVEAILPVIVPGTGTSYFDASNNLLFHGGAAVPYRSGYPFKNPFAQPDLEIVLRRELENHPLVTVCFATELVHLDASADHVTAHLKSDEIRTVDCQYVLAADGGRSPVRMLLGIDMTGTSHDDVWLVLDCLGDHHRERYGMHHGDPNRPHVIVPGLNGRCRYEFYLYPGEGEPTTEPPFALIQKLLAPYRTITPAEVERAVSYRFNGVNADEWRRGRVFLLGDAAHMMPPFAGQGLNSGIRDAANLTWKIASALQGTGDDALLDTYQAERRPHAEAVIRSSERLGEIVMTTDPARAQLRDSVVRAALTTAEGREFFEHMKYRPDVRLTDGLIAPLSSHPMVGRPIGQPTVFDYSRRKAVPLDEVLGNGWSVVGSGVGPDADSAAWDAAVDACEKLGATFVDVPYDDTLHPRSSPVRVAIDLDTRLCAEFEQARGRFVLVRPDRVVAAVVDAAELGAAAASFTHASLPPAAEPALA